MSKRQQEKEELKIALNTLEKAGQYSSAKWLKNVCLIPQTMQKPAWSEEDENILDAITYTVKNSGYKHCIGVSNEMMIAFIKSLKDRVLPKQEWSEEDEKAINDIMWIIEAYRKNGFNETHIQIADSSENWLKSLEGRILPQNITYYNPYKAVVESIAEMCKHYDKASHNGLRDFYDNVKVKCKDAKEYDSLYPQNTWKPSDEHMKALDIAIRCGIQLGTWEEDALKSLKEQLKKLIEK